MLSDKLEHEHHNFEELFQQIGNTDPKSAVEMAAFKDALLEHFAEEEAFLYPVAQMSGWTGGAAVIEFRYQHQYLRNLLKELEENIAGSQSTYDHFLSKLREHFRGEELVVFPLADQTE